VTKHRETRRSGYVTSIEETENAHGTVVEKPEVKKPSRLRRHKVKMALKEIGCVVWTRFM
jgi:hypothetical protein